MKHLIKALWLTIILITLGACTENIEKVSEIHLDMNLETYQTTTEQNYISIEIADLDTHIKLTIRLEGSYAFEDEIDLYVNQFLIEKAYDSKSKTQVVYTLQKNELVDPNQYVDVLVSFDPNGGYWPKNIFEDQDPLYQLPIIKTQVTTTQQLSLFDHTTTQLRWHDKLILTYHESMQAYEVIYKDLATASIENLGVTAFDLVIAIPINTTEQHTQDILRALITSDDKLFVTFSDEDLDQAEQLEVIVYAESAINGLYQNTYVDSEKLPEPIREEFTFAGWTDGTQIFSHFPRYQHKDQIQHITYTAVWEGASLSELNAMLQQLIPSTMTGNLNLPTSYSGFTIVWSSSDEDVISHEGVYKKPYEGLVVRLTATITSDQHQFTRGYDVSVEGYKSLSNGIASSYIYRNYESVDDQFFQTLDIINLAFITANADAELHGTSVLNNYQTYIKEKARLNGNWVVMSIAPESSWSVIAASPTLIQRLADNIVKMINQYGFDGVDIDWETPTSAEAPRFTDLMRAVYQKVKANNPNHLVTTAITGGMWQVPRYDLNNSLQYLDYINMMTYGMTSNSGQYHNALYPISSFHNTTFNAGRTLVSCSIEESIQIFNQQFNVPNSKIIVGAAFYGIRQVRTFNQSTQSWSTWQNAGSIHYTEIARDLLNHPNYTEYYDTRAGVPYMLKNDGTEFISYDNPRSIREKSEYVLAQGLAGIMYWEHGTDATGLLLNAIRVGMQK